MVLNVVIKKKTRIYATPAVKGLNRLMVCKARYPPRRGTSLLVSFFPLSYLILVLKLCLQGV